MVLDPRQLTYEIELRQTILSQSQQIEQLLNEIAKLKLQLKEKEKECTSR